MRIMVPDGRIASTTEGFHCGPKVAVPEISVCYQAKFLNES